MRFRILLTSLVFAPFMVWAQLPPEDKHWELVFEDHFDTLDHSVWTVAHHFDHYGEPQVYTDRPENVMVKNGELILQVRKEKYNCPELGGAACNKSKYDYTSGWIETKLWNNIRYGYMESRMKLPFGSGFWPAFWTFAVADQSNRSNVAEIDVFEMLGSHPPTQMGTNMHLEYCRCQDNSCPCEYLGQIRCPENNPEIRCNGLDVQIPDYSENYLVYGLEWTPDKIIWYVNGQMVRNTKNPGIVDPVRVIFNLAITPWQSPDHTTPFPSSMHIDYFRLYQMSGEIDIPDTLRLGGLEAGQKIAPKDTITFRAIKEIEIGGEFVIPLGSSVYMDVNGIH